MQTTPTLKISLVDDDSQMRAMLEDFIKEKYPSAEITVYSTGEDALAHITTHRDLIVLDYNLDSINTGGINGLQVLKKLKERLPNVTIVFSSAQEKSEVAANAIMSGAKDYIVKNEKIFQRLDATLNSIIGKPVQATPKKRSAFTTIIIIAAIVLTGILLWKALKP